MHVAIITIEKSVGENGANQALDFAAISGALFAIGPARGGSVVPPISIPGLGIAIKSFQKFQQLAVTDGRVDPNGKTLKRMNELLGGGVIPSIGTVAAGGLRPMREFSGMALEVYRASFTPIEDSLTKDMVFQWSTVLGAGRIYYFELDENVVPKWFGALVPDGLTQFDKPHIFFHPTPMQAGYHDAQYQKLGSFHKIFHYLSDDMGSQVCASNTGRVLIMPLMTQGAAGTCGIFPQRWEGIVSQMLGMLKAGDMSPAAPPVSISSVVVSSFSSGITYSHAFRSKAQLGDRLAGVIDLDGIISTYKQLSPMIKTPAGRVVRMQQTKVKESELSLLAGQNVFPVPKPRWGGPFYYWAKQAHIGQIHGMIPQTMMYIAARRAG
jgi:hypothetical protein